MLVDMSISTAIVKSACCQPYRYKPEKGGFMKISVEKNVVEFVPESDQETTQLETLWNTIVDCVKFNKKLVPIGEYVPQKSNTARFTIEGQ
jgi:hypothetical protein